MRLDEVTCWRNRVGKLGAVLFILLVLAALDGLSVRFREPENLFRLVSGDSTKITGNLRGDITDTGQLEVTSTSDLIGLSFEGVYSGFWLGGSNWRGVLRTDPALPPGEYRVTVTLKGDTSKQATATYLVEAYRNYEDFRKGAKSFFRSWLDLSPWWAFGIFFALTALSLGAVFVLSGKREHLLREEGMAEIYYVKKTEEGFNVGFPLGTIHGVQAGDRLSLFDEYEVPAGTVVVVESTPTDSVAHVEPGEAPKIKPGYLVSRTRF